MSYLRPVEGIKIGEFRDPLLVVGAIHTICEFFPGTSSPLGDAGEISHLSVVVTGVVLTTCELSDVAVGEVGSSAGMVGTVSVVLTSVMGCEAAGVMVAGAGNQGSSVFSGCAGVAWSAVPGFCVGCMAGTGLFIAREASTFAEKLGVASAHTRA